MTAWAPAAAAMLIISFAEEKISSYEVDIDIHEDSSITILETIQYDFGENDRRGIFREIPVSYKTPYGNRGIDLEILHVSRDGFPEKYTNRKDGKNRVLKIGDASVYIAGEHTYRITYEIEGAFNAFSDFDELYWNAIGGDWNVPIENGIVKVTAPKDITKAECFAGLLGSNVSCQSSSIDGKVFTGAAIDIGNGSGMTVAVALPKGAVTLPSALETLGRFLLSNSIFLIPIFVFLLMFRHWKERGRDAKGRGTIIPEYNPPEGLTPLFLGSIIDGTLNDHDIVAGMLYLAEQGYLTIERTEKKRFLGSNVDYILTWTGDIEELNHKEQLVAELLFDINVEKGTVAKLSDLKKDTGVSGRKSRLSTHIDEELKAQGYFANKPQQTIVLWVVFGVVIIFASTFLGAFFGIATAFAVGISGAIVLVFGSLMPKLTKKGALVRENILGFKNFLSVTEKERLEFHNAPEKSSVQFMEFLPFAAALGVEEKWAEQFKNLEMSNPSWYSGGSFNSFTPTAFASDMSSFSTSMSAGVTAASGGSGSSGGGFSGGGMGGGGGGSW